MSDLATMVPAEQALLAALVMPLLAAAAVGLLGRAPQARDGVLVGFAVVTFFLAVQLIAPVRDTKVVRVDRYGQGGNLHRHPYPLNDNSFVVAMTPYMNARQEGRQYSIRFHLYWMDIAGRRERAQRIGRFRDDRRLGDGADGLRSAVGHGDGRGWRHERRRVGTGR